LLREHNSVPGGRRSASVATKLGSAINVAETTRPMNPGNVLRTATARPTVRRQRKRSVGKQLVRDESNRENSGYSAPWADVKGESRQASARSARARDERPPGDEGRFVDSRTRDAGETACQATGHGAMRLATKKCGAVDALPTTRQGDKCGDAHARRSMRR